LVDNHEYLTCIKFKFKKSPSGDSKFEKYFHETKCILSFKKAFLVIASLKSIFMKQNASK